LLQCRGGQARLVALVAQQDDVIGEAGGLRMAMLAVRIQPPLQDVAGDDQRPGDRPFPGDLRVTADIDQRRARAIACRA
jgi:hypothetical protein